MRPARSSTATCFCTAAKLISYRSARSDTDGVSVSDRAKMPRRVPSAKARKSWLSDSSLSFLPTTIWLYVNLVRSLLQHVFARSLSDPTKTAHWGRGRKADVSKRPLGVDEGRMRASKTNSTEPPMDAFDQSNGVVTSRLWG